MQVINESLKKKPRCGFGIIVGKDNSLACFDFDHALTPEGTLINPVVEVFLKLLGSFVEVSTSGTGLHALVSLDEPHPEYGFDKSICDGKFYPARFIKLTGDVFSGYDLPIKTITKRDSEAIQNKIGIARPDLPAPVNRAAYSGKSRNWSDILSEVGILHITASQYIGSTRQHGIASRTCIDALKITCPNVAAHTAHGRANDFSADAAILSQWDDGSSSCTCNHNSCNPVLHPNLLHKLWRQVKMRRVEIGRIALRSAGVRI